MGRRLCCLAVVTALAISITAVPAGAGLSFITEVSSEGNAFPNAVAAGDGDNFYTLDTNTSEVVKYHLWETASGRWNSELIGKFGADRGLSNPRGIAFGNDMVYVTSVGTNEILAFNTNGAFVVKWGGTGSGDGQFDYPSSVAVDSSGFVYVVDARNQRVQKFTSDGDFISKFGSQGSGDGQFSVSGTAGIAIDKFDNIYVSDEPLHRIQKFSSTGTFITKWGEFGSEKGQLAYPDELAIDKDGNILVAESGGQGCIASPRRANRSVSSPARGRRAASSIHLTGSRPMTRGSMWPALGRARSTSTTISIQDSRLAS